MIGLAIIDVSIWQFLQVNLLEIGGEWNYESNGL